MLIPVEVIIRNLEGGGRRCGRPLWAMKRLMYACLTLLLVVLLCAPVLAQAESTEFPLSVSIELSNNVFTKPEEITVTINVTNTTDGDMAGPVTLYYPNGKIIEEFGSPTLAAGQSKSWTGTWSVTQEQLEKSRIAFAVNQVRVDDEGQLYNHQRNYGKALHYNGAEAIVEINRHIAPTTAGKGQEVSVTYEIMNVGTVDISDVTITEHSSISKTKGEIDAVPAGEKASHTFTVAMGTKDLTSRATITYKASGKTTSVKKDEAVIKYGEVKLNATLSSDKKGGAAGDTVKLTLTLKNTGKVDYQSGTVTDSLLGELFTGVSIPAGKSVTLEKEITIVDTASYQFVVTAQDASGGTVETASSRVTITEVDPSQAAVLQVVASADSASIHVLPGVVRFHVDVTNTGAVEATDVTVSASDVELYTFSSILPGETRSFDRDISVPMTGKYRFDASLRNALEETETFQSNIVQITYVEPTAAPVEEPIPTPVIPSYRELPTQPEVPAYVATVQRILTSANGVLLVLTGICALLLVVGVIRRMQANAASKRAEDHLERSSARTYDQPATRKSKKVRRQLELPEDDEEEADAEPFVPAPAAEPAPEKTARVQDNTLMEERLRQLYPRDDQPAEEETSAPAAEGARRRHRRSGDDA